jgi:hypothetical protein
MGRLSARRLVSLILAVCMAAGLSMSVVQVNGMALKMAMASPMSSSGGQHCSDCPDGSSGNGPTSACLFVSLAPSLAMAPEVALAPVLRERPTFIVSLAQLAGMTLPPDPYPPRTPFMA